MQLVAKMPTLAGSIECIFLSGDGPYTCPRCGIKTTMLLCYVRRFDCIAKIHCGCLTNDDRNGAVITPQNYRRSGARFQRRVDELMQNASR